MMLSNPNRIFQLFSLARSIILLITHLVSSQLNQRSYDLVEYNMFYLQKYHDYHDPQWMVRVRLRIRVSVRCLSPQEGA